MKKLQLHKCFSRDDLLSIEKKFFEPYLINSDRYYISIFFYYIRIYTDIFNAQKNEI